jgi:hypothetical protein
MFLLLVFSDAKAAHSEKIDANLEIRLHAKGFPSR